MKKVALLLAFCTLLSAAPYKVGEVVAPLSLNDQFGKLHVFKEMPKTVVMAFEKGTATTVNEYLATKDKSYLSTHKAAFIAEISQMPRFITQAFALPKMRKYPYTVLLIDDEEQGLKYPYQENKITVMKFNGNILSAVQFAGTPQELQSAIEQ